MLVMMILGDDPIDIDHQILLRLVQILGLLHQVLLVDLELGVIQERKLLFTLDSSESLVRQVLLPHDEELKIGLEKHQPVALRVRVTVILDDPVKDVQDSLHLDGPEVQNRQILVVSLHDLLDLFREKISVVSLLLSLGDESLRNVEFGLEQRVKDALGVRFLFLLVPIKLLLPLGSCPSST